MKQRYKQIEIGKKTLGYNLYVQAVPKKERRHRDETHPTTPDHLQTCSKRSWDGQIKVWRRRLHFWTPPTEDGKKADDLKSSLDASGGFYEAEEDAKTPSFSVFASRPLPEVVPVNVEPMQLGNGDNSLLGQWAANSNSARAMDLQGESCVPGGPLKDEDSLLFIPFQFE